MAKPVYNWISEEDAAKLMNYAPRSLRQFTRGSRAKLPISTTKTNSKTVLYSKTDIEKFLNSQVLA